MMSLALCVIILTGLLGNLEGIGVGWNNWYGGDVSFTCEPGEAINEVSSVHRNMHEDRLWKFGCKPMPHKSSCYWTYFVNYFYQNSNFACAENYVVAGVNSYHYGYYYLDRRWRYKCCTGYGFVTSECEQTGWLNYWDEVLTYQVPEHYYLTGLYSYHNGYHRDRRWRFTICKGPSSGVYKRSVDQAALEGPDSSQDAGPTIPAPVFDGVRHCAHGQVADQITSDPNESQEDHLWRFTCKAFVNSSQCEWHQFGNKSAEVITFKCPANKVIAGVNTYNSKSPGDRRLQVNCCGAHGFVTGDCDETLYIYETGENIKWFVPAGNFLTGIRSYNDDYSVDLGWIFTYCAGS